MQKAFKKSLTGVLTILLLHGCVSTSMRVQVSKNTNVAPNIHHPSYKDVWSALMALQTDMDSLQRFAPGIEMELFSKGLEYVRHGEDRQAEIIFKALSDTAFNPLVRKQSGKIYANLLFNAGKFQELSRLRESAPATDSSEVDNGVLINAFRLAARETYHFPDNPVKLPLALSKTGTPVVPVRLNGRKFNFWIDTGAGLSVLSSEVAEKCGVQTIGKETTSAGTATSKRVNIRPAIIDSLHISSLCIDNHPAIIIDKSDLEFKLLGLITMVKIDGIIGWNAIRNMRLEIDFANHEVSISKPRQRNSLPSNLFWLGYPIVELISENGVPLYFGLDTGARKSAVTQNIFTKIKAQPGVAKKETVGSAGGFEELERKTLANMTLHLGKYQLQFRDIKTLPAKGAVFIKTDGVIGSDVFNGARLIIDYQNNYLGYEALNDN
ncbi:MAG: aspartyl protease family protein [Deferribacteres bacterium]|nr:aspartyl protease family protein [candidate division KSB1 bacterium]MCB9502748.1 aspartyl protease family protein [Deferribacteres bacterium]